MKIYITRLINRLYRNFKTLLLLRKFPVLTPIFFYMLQVLDVLMSSRRVARREAEVNKLWKQVYFLHWSFFKESRLFLRTEHSLAQYSDDFRFPRGARFDNSRHYRFNLALYRHFNKIEKIRLLDLGCAGGGLVRSFLEDGHVAIGLEGANISKVFRTGEWDNIPYHLFTCDITKPFTIVDSRANPFLFDIITAWEVLEHIPQSDIPGLLNHIYWHLEPGGLVIVSIDLLPDGNPLTGAVYHQTLQPANWWRELFIRQGFILDHDCKFSAEDMVRGNGLSLKDWWPGDGQGLHIIGKKAGSNVRY